MGLRVKVDSTWGIRPHTGSSRMYTSGWPKNQNRCWNRIGSPPPAASKKWVPKWRSVSSMVTPPASTGRVMISSTAVTSQPQQKRGIFISVMPGARMLRWWR
jgi:hypothetical protein